MAENIQRTKGRSGAYKLDRGGNPAESGPYIGVVTNNVDPTRSGRLQVWIEDFAGPNKEDETLWRTVSYISPFYGTTQQSGTNQGDGGFVGNPHSYGMWFTPPDIGTQIICFFASGDPDQGYYIGSVIDSGISHMVPAIGATKNYALDNSSQDEYFKSALRLPTVEINSENDAISEDPRFFDKPKPVHSVVAGVLLQQGLINDTVRGTIGSNSQRESPSTVYGVSTPGRPIFAGGVNDKALAQQLTTENTNAVIPPGAVEVIGRRGGHSLVMDDGDLSGQDQLVRLRTANGHQILMSDSGECLFIIHANGQTWVELGKEGTIDIYASNSINLRSQGDLNLHADRNVNINAGMAFNINAGKTLSVAAEVLQVTASKSATIYSDSYVGIKSDGTLSLQSAKAGTWNGGDSMSLSAGCINLNGGQAPAVMKPSPINKKKLPDTKFEQGKGWIVEQNKIDTVVTRAPTHEPYPYHNTGVSSVAELVATSPEEVSAAVETTLNGIQDTEFDPIEADDYAKETKAEVKVGSISEDQVTGMLAQTSKLVPQSFNEVSDTLGVGKFGLTPTQLEKTGYLKPGTVDFFLKDGTASLTSVLSSPNVWTGKNNIGALSNLLTDQRLQTTVQTDLFQDGLQSLKNIGLVTGTEDPSKLAPLVSTASKYGAEVTKSWVNGKVSDTTTLASINQIARGSQYSVDLVTQKVNESVKGFDTSGTNFSLTTVRSAIDNAVTNVIGNSKVPGPGAINE